MTSLLFEDYLSDHEFFSNLDKAYVKYLAGCATKLKISEGNVLFKQAEHADKFYLLRKGQIAVQIPAIMGPALQIQMVSADQLLGWSWLIPPYRWNFQALAIEDSELLEFDGVGILAHCEEDPKFGYELVRRFAALMSERLDAARQKMMDEWNPPGFA